MAQATHYKCHAPCGYIGETSEFLPGINGRICPKCGADDCTFPHRLFRCKGCGKVGDQSFWFLESGLDEHPLEGPEAFWLDAVPCEDCVGKWWDENRPKGRISNESERLFYENWTKVRKLPAQVEEVPITDKETLRR